MKESGEKRPDWEEVVAINFRKNQQKKIPLLKLQSILWGMKPKSIVNDIKSKSDRKESSY